MKLPIKLPQPLTRMMGKLWLKAKSASPEICVISGIVAGGTALVMVGVKTWKGKDTLAKDAKALKDAKNAGTKTNEIPVEEKDENGNTISVRKDLVTTTTTLTKDEKRMVWAKRIDFGKDICKIYWIPAVLGISSVGLIWGGRTILRKELSSLAAAYATLAESYRRYREKVIAEYGAEKDEEFQYGVKTIEAIDAETGETVKKTVIDKEDNISRYGTVFNEGDFDRSSGTWTWKNYVWSPNKIANKMTIRELAKEGTFLINTTGFCDAEKLMLKSGMDPQEAYEKYHGTGWIFKKGEKNVVEFGVEPGPNQLPCNVGFWDDNCSQNTCILNPNVDGYIGYIYENMKDYDFRYGSARRRPKSIRREMDRLVRGYEEEQMEKMLENREVYNNGLSRRR